MNAFQQPTISGLPRSAVLLQVAAKLEEVTILGREDVRHFVKLTIGWKIRRGGPPPPSTPMLLRERYLRAQWTDLHESKFFPSKKSIFNGVWYFFGVLAATNLSKMSICSSSITKIALWWILIYRTIIPVITAHISFGNQSIDQFWSSDTLGSHFYNLKYSNHHRNDRNIWEISREIWQWKSILKCQNRLQCIRTSMY